MGFSVVCQVFLNRVVVTVLADLQLCFSRFVFQSLRLLLVRAVTLWHRHFGTVGTDTLARHRHFGTVGTDTLAQTLWHIRHRHFGTIGTDTLAQ